MQNNFYDDFCYCFYHYFHIFNKKNEEHLYFMRCGETLTLEHLFDPKLACFMNYFLYDKEDKIQYLLPEDKFFKIIFSPDDNPRDSYLLKNVSFEHNIEKSSDVYWNILFKIVQLIFEDKRFTYQNNCISLDKIGTDYFDFFYDQELAYSNT